MSLTLFTGIAFILAALLLLSRQILITPSSRTFPCAPYIVRLVMFVAGCAFFWVGALFAFQTKATPYAGDAALPVALLSLGLAFYQAIMVLTLLAQRRNPRVRGALDRLERMTSSPGLAAFSRRTA